MSKTITPPAKKPARKTGEHVSFHARLDPALTKELGDGIVEAVVTTGSLDHHGEQIDMDGVDVSDYHGTVLYGHDYQGLPIGKTLKLDKMKSKIKAKFQLAVDAYPFAKTVYDMIVGGYLTDVSIGGLVKKWSDDYTTIEEMTMKEFSVVPIGANPEAMITAKQLGKTAEQVQSEFREFAKSATLDKLKQLDDDEINQAIKVLENLLAALKESAQAASTAGNDETAEVRRIIHITLRDSAKAVATQSQRVIKTLKLKHKG